MQVKLIVLEGSRVGMEVPVPGPKFFIGRDADCQLRPNSDMVSRHHCVLLVEQGYAAVRDFGSKNGTYVNEQRIVGEQPLKAGDTLGIGPLRFEVVVHHGVGGPKRPAVKDVKEAAGRTVAQTNSSDMDITSWLTEGDAHVGLGTKDGETSDLDASRIKLGDEVPLNETTVIGAEATTGVAHGRDEPTRIDHGSKVPQQEPHDTSQTISSVPPGIAVPSASKSKDTRTAAVDVLKKLRKQQQQHLAQQSKQPKKPKN